MGGGLAGLAAGSVLTQAGLSVKVFEKDTKVGELSRTVVHSEFRYDLGGNRFFTKNKMFVKNEDPYVFLSDSFLIELDNSAQCFVRHLSVDPGKRDCGNVQQRRSKLAGTVRFPF